MDWAHLGTHVLAGWPTPLYLFVFILGFSRALYAEVTTSTDLPTFIDCHLHASAALGGMPEEILIDYVSGHIIRPMFPPALCGRGLVKAFVSWRCALVRPHNDHRESSQRNNSWSSRHVALRGNPGEEAGAGGSHARSAASLAWMFTSA